MIYLLDQSTLERYEQCFHAFYFVLGENEETLKLLEHAVDVINLSAAESGSSQKHLVVHEFIHQDSSRKFWKVAGSNNNEYFCLYNFCSCPHYMQMVKSASIDKSTCHVCKHMIAVRLASALKLIDKHSVSLEVFMQHMCGEKLAQSISFHH